MKTTVDIPEDLLNDAVSLAGNRSKRETVMAVRSEFTRLRRMRRLVDAFGTCDKLMTVETLERQRSEG
jgi:hypothetical protein